MPEISNSLQKSSNLTGNLQESNYFNISNPQINPAKINKELKDEYVKSKKNRGLLEKFFASISNLSPFGISARSVNKALKQNAIGKISDDKVRETIKKNEDSITLGTNLTINTISAATAMSVGFFGKNISGLIGEFNKSLSGKTKLITTVSSLLAGVAVNFALKGINLIGKPKEGIPKNELGNTIANSLISGVGGCASAINPFFLPITFMASLVNNHFNSENNGNSNSFIRNIKDNLGTLVISSATLGFIGAKGHINFAKIAEVSKKVAINKVHTNLYKPPIDQLTEFQQLARDIGYDLSILVKDGKVDPRGISKLDEDFIKILMEEGQNGQIESKIKKLEAENIFLPKYLQTVIDIPDSLQEKLCTNIDLLCKNRNNSTWNGRTFDFESIATSCAFEELDKKHLDLNGLKDLQAIIQRIKSNCPKSREISEAQEMLNKAFPTSKYEITRLLGVGSIAESYLAKAPNGDEVVIKIVKDHFLHGNKIAIDKAKTLRKIEIRSREDWSLPSKRTIRTKERKQYDIEQVNNMYKVWGDEIDLTMEATSAKEIATQANRFKPVSVIDASKNIFIMEKAQGVQMDSSKFVDEWKRTNLTEEDFTKFVEDYVQVYCEQLFALPKTGKKVVQSDPHGGNILVDVSKIRDIAKGETPITIIDYGNTTKTERKEAIKNLFNHIDYLVGNTDGIAKAMLEGANLGGQNQKEITQKLSSALKNEIYNTDTKIDIDNPVKIFSTVNGFCLNFLQKNNVIPNAAHINQMKAEETYIISNLGCLRNVAESCGYDLSKAIRKDKIIGILKDEMSKAVQDSAKYEPRLTLNEISKRYKFFAGNTEEALTSLSVNFGI